MKRGTKHKSLLANIVGAFLIAVGAIALAGCRLSNAAPDESPQMPLPPVVTTPPGQNADGAGKPPTMTSIAVTVTTDKTNYRAEEIVRFTITAHNKGKTEQSLIFSSGQSFDIRIRENRKDESPVVWNWSHGKMFTMALRGMKIAPGATKTYEATWDQKDNEGAIVPRSNYRVEARLTANGGIHAEPIIIGLID
ncbi:MAG TPA: BsuPI-related putative proteinase inhibitor [Abditibacteriaceae bacterium]|nr:BsuPI-related putative proteinase inhibitor [Abditibacteriaceae bacterium]